MLIMEYALAIEDIKGKLSEKRFELILFVIIFVIAFSARYATLMDAGITWDEPDYIYSSIVYADNLRHLNFDSNAYVANNEHPPLAKYLYGVAILIFNGGEENYNAYVVTRTLSAVLGALSCILVYLIGRDFFSEQAGLVSALILALTPVYIAHTQIAALDGPMTFFFTLTMYLFMAGLKNMNKIILGLSAVSLGLLVDTKFTGLLILPLLAILYIVHNIYGRDKANKKNIGLLRIFPLHYVVLFLVIAAFTTLIIYPWMWGGFNNFMLTIDHWTLWSKTPTEYFFGSVQEAPVYYYLVYFLATTPALLFIPLIASAYYIIRSRDPYKLAVLLWLIVPFAYSFASFKQNGMRYILMIYPALALICAVGLEKLSLKLSTMLSNWTPDRILQALSIVTVIYLLVSLILVSPYYLDYYNELTGGPANVGSDNMLAFGWWGEGVYDSIQYLERNAPGSSTIYLDITPVHTVSIYPNPGGLNYTLNDADFGAADYVLVNAWNERSSGKTYDPSDYRLVHVTRVFGAPLVKVYEKIS